MVKLFGYSFGGEFALEITLALPHKISKVILSGTSLIGLKTQYLIKIAGFISIADTALISKIESILEDQGSVEEKYISVWKATDLETVVRLFFENQCPAKV